MIKKRTLWIALIVVAILAAGGYYTYSVSAQSASGEQESAPLQTAVARRGDMVIFASAVGEVIPATALSLGFDEGGTVVEVLVSVGEKVEAGQVLARLQTDKTEEEIAADLANAELAVLTAQQDLDEIYSNQPMEAALALQSIEDAQSALDDLNVPEARIAAAQVGLVDAQDSLTEAQNERVKLDYARADDLTIEEAYVNYLFAKDAYDNAQKAFNEVAHKDIKNQDRVLALQRLVDAEAKMKSALATYNYLYLPASDSDVAEADAGLAQAQAALDAAQIAYDQALAGPTTGEIAVAEATLEAAQAAYDRIKDGPDPLDIAIAEAKLTSAKADLAAVQSKQSIIELTAPIDGTITEISASEGETVGTSAVITLADLDHPLMEVYLDETDLANVALGFEADVSFDALPDETFKGTVIEVSPVLENVGGVSAVKTLVQLTDYAKATTLPIGLSASVDVIGGRAENAVLVPVEALRELGPDEYAVFVVEDGGEPRLRVVEVGLVDFTSAEIISGLEAGEVVTTGIVETE